MRYTTEEELHEELQAMFNCAYEELIERLYMSELLAEDNAQRTWDAKAWRNENLPGNPTDEEMKTRIADQRDADVNLRIDASIRKTCETLRQTLAGRLVVAPKDTSTDGSTS